MRFALIAIPAMLVCGSAFAEGWQEYIYADYQFAVSFPDTPKIEAGRFDLPGGASVPARIYSVTLPDGDYRVVIADFTNRPESEAAIINAAEDALKRNGAVKVELPARVQAVFGRQLSVAGRDGSHTSAVVLMFQHRMYEIAGTVSPAAAQAGSSDAIRFQQSLRFTGSTMGFLGVNLLFGVLRRL